MDRLDALEIFRTIVDVGSITATAERLGVSKAMISKSLAALEERLGARLIERTTRSMAPTELGQLVYDQSDQLLEGYAHLENLIKEQQGQAQGLLRVSVPISFPIDPIADLVVAFTLAEPNVRVEIERSDGFVNLIDDGFDVALRMANLADSQLIAKKIAPLSGGFFASPQYLQARGTPLHPDEIGRHDCILDSHLRPKRHFSFLIDGKITSMPIKGVIGVNGVSAAVEFARRGVGIMAAPLVAVKADVDRGDLVPVLPNFAPPPYGLYLLYPGRQYLPLKVRRFVDLAAERLRTAVEGA